MIRTTYCWSADLHGASPSIRRDLEKLYGSKKSGTIYVIADGRAEAVEVIKEMFTRNGHVPPPRIDANQTHLIAQAMRMVY